MKKNEFLFQEQPSVEHEKNVAVAVQDSLRRNRAVSNSRESFWSTWSWGAMGLSSAALVGIISYFLIRNKEPQEGTEFLALSDLIEANDFENEDLDLLSQDLDLIEDLELLEEMEQS